MKNVEKTPSFIIHEKKGNVFWDIDAMIDTPLGQKEGFKDFDSLTDSE